MDTAHIWLILLRNDYLVMWYLLLCSNWHKKEIIFFNPHWQLCHHVTADQQCWDLVSCPWNKFHLLYDKTVKKRKQLAECLTYRASRLTKLQSRLYWDWMPRPTLALFTLVEFLVACSWNYGTIQFLSVLIIPKGANNLCIFTSSRREIFSLDLSLLLTLHSR